MEEAKYTPAPWWVDEFSDGDVRVVADPSKGATPPVCDGRTFICKMYQEDKRGIDAKANARLISAAPALFDSHEPEREGADFLDWIADRLVNVHGENESADFIICLRRRAAKARAAIAKALGN